MICYKQRSLLRIKKLLKNAFNGKVERVVLWRIVVFLNPLIIASFISDYPHQCSQQSAVTLQPLLSRLKQDELPLRGLIRTNTRREIISLFYKNIWIIDVSALTALLNPSSSQLGSDYPSQTLHTYVPLGSLLLKDSEPVQSLMFSDLWKQFYFS